MIASGEKSSKLPDRILCAIAGLNPETSATPTLLNLTGLLPYEAFKFQNTTFGIV